MMRRARLGMTLIEVVVALTIAGIALAAGASVLGFLTDQQTRAIGDAVTRSAATRASLREWLAGAQLGTTGELRFVGTRIIEPTSPSYSSLEFITSAATPVAAGGDARTRVRLILNRTPADQPPQLVAELTALPRGETTMLAIKDSATAFDIRYRASVSAASPWIDSWVSTSVLPAVIELRIGASGSDLLSVPLLVVVGERR